ncbi:MAG: hypothetical protein AB8C95_16200, partial [Phycisphaeraceae bacterium]
MTNPFALLLAQTDAPEAAPAEAAAPPVEENIEQVMEEVANTSKEALSGDTGAMMELVQAYAMPIVWAIVILVVAWIISKIVGNGIRRSLAKAKVDETLSRFFGKLAGYLILILGVIFALSKFGIDV